ncbi:MAG: HlyD family efflux transporter periplasmic adaptor subunit [bacterium]|nr:HlyD family efflux transporter periplasmic adaptor subunit [bacterium]
MKILFSILKKVQLYATSHRNWAMVLVVMMILGGYWGIQSFTAGEKIQYALALVQKGTIEVRVAGSGQISTSNQVEVSSQTSGELISVSAKTGQEIKAGTIIAQTDAGDAFYNYEKERILHEELTTIDPDNLRDAENAFIETEEDLADAYISAQTSLISASTEMADAMEGLELMFNCNTGYLSSCHATNRSDTEKKYLQKAESSWYRADNLFDELSTKYQTISQTSTKEEIESAVLSTRNLAIIIGESAKYTQDAVIYFRNRANEHEQSQADEAYAQVTPLVSSANAVVGELTTSKNLIMSTKRAFEDAKYNLAKIKKGADVLDIRSSELSVRQKKDALALHYIRAPFDGIVASIEARKGQNINNGTTIATLITKQKIAEISLNEVDVAKVILGQKALLVLDAIENLTIEGKVVEIDAIGTENQGVVTYQAKISFDSRDERIKSGMSVSAEIITNTKMGVLFVPNTAVKFQDHNFVEVVRSVPSELSMTASVNALSLPNLPEKQVVEIGISNDEVTEIIGGLIEGDVVVTRIFLGNTEVLPQNTQRGGLFGGRR